MKYCLNICRVSTYIHPKVQLISIDLQYNYGKNKIQDYEYRSRKRDHKSSCDVILHDVIE